MAWRRGRRWIASWYQDGSRRTKSCPTRDAAERVEHYMRGRELMITMGITTRREAEATARANVPPGFVVGLYCESIESRGVSAAHIRELQRAAHQVLVGFQTLAEVKPARVDWWLAERAAARGWSPRTRNHYLRSARAVVTWAASNGYLAEDPLRSLRPLEDPASTRERRALTVEEFNRLRLWLRFPECVICAFTGLRWSEALALRMADMDYERGTITVPKGVGKRDRRVRSVLPMASIVAEQLPQRPAIGQARLMSWRPTARVWRLAMERYGIEHRTAAGLAAPSSMRPTFCTWLAEAGVELDTIMRLRRDRGPLAEARYVDRRQLLDGMRSGLERMVSWYRRRSAEVVA